MCTDKLNYSFEKGKNDSLLIIAGFYILSFESNIYFSLIQSRPTNITVVMSQSQKQVN